MSTDTGRPERAPLGSLAGLARTAWAPWPIPEVLESTPSTMADVERRAAAGAPEGTAVIAEEQTAGRGRRGRTWESPARAGLWWSVLLHPPVAPERLGWLPLVVGVGVAEALRAQVRDVAGVDARLKWPNDVLVGDGKIAGVLAERLASGAVVVGVGVNVDQVAAELPAGGTSMRLLGCAVDRTALLVQILTSVAGVYRRWAAGEDLSAAYARLSITLGSEVTAHLDDHVLEGRATHLGPSGELVIEDPTGATHVVSAGDVTLRRMPR